MFSFLKKMFHREGPKGVVEIEETPKMLEKPCKTCGKPLFYDPSWDHIPNYCRDCRKKYWEEHETVRVMRRKCKNCGKSFTFPNNVRHYPNYCKACRAKFKETRGK